MTRALPFQVHHVLGNLAARLGKLPTVAESMAIPLADRKAQVPSRWVLRPRPAGVSVEDSRAGSVPVRLYRPASPSGRALLYITGAASSSAASTPATTSAPTSRT